MNWIKISQEEYKKLVARHNVKDVYEIFTDAKGGLSPNYLHPIMYTIWSYNSKPFLKSLATKKHESDKDWDWEFFKRKIKI